jgi:plastocyanin
MSTHSRTLFWSACAALLILACLSAGCSSSTSPAPSAAATQTPAAGGNTIAIRNFAFSPSTLTVKAGTTVTWTNDDSPPHQLASDAGAPVAFSSPSLANGASFPFTFSQAGTYPYHCTIHPSMKGTIVVQA